MAFTVTARHTGNNATVASQTLATDSQTPTASSLFIVAAGGVRNGQVAAYSWQTPVGGGYTYTNLQVPNTAFNWAADATFAAGGAVWRADVGGSPSAHTVTVDPHSGTETCFLGAVGFDITGHSSSTPVQSKAGGADAGTAGDSVTGTITLDSAPTAGNLIVVCWMVAGDAVGGVTSPTSNGQTFTTITNQTPANCHVSCFYRVATGAENATISTTDLGQTVGAYAVIAFEIAGDAVASPSVPLQQWPNQGFGPWPRRQLATQADAVASSGFSGDAALTVTEAITADGRTEGSGSLTETATVTSSGRGEGTASLSVTDSITSAGQAQGAASLTATATITASGEVRGSASLTGTASITTADRTEGTASLTVTATITAAGGPPGSLSGTASLTVTDSITASGRTEGSASLTETATVTSSGRAEGTASLTETATITPAGEARGTASLSETATITPAGQAQGTATRSTTATIASSGRAEGSASVAGTAAITATGQMTASGQATSTITATITASGIASGAGITPPRPSRVSTGPQHSRAGTSVGHARVSTGNQHSRASTELG